MNTLDLVVRSSPCRPPGLIPTRFRLAGGQLEIAVYDSPTWDAHPEDGAAKFSQFASRLPLHFFDDQSVGPAGYGNLKKQESLGGGRIAILRRLSSEGSYVSKLGYIVCLFLTQQVKGRKDAINSKETKKSFFCHLRVSMMLRFFNF